jgi:hypothetical protein
MNALTIEDGVLPTFPISATGVNAGRKWPSRHRGSDRLPSPDGTDH